MELSPVFFYYMTIKISIKLWLVWHCPLPLSLWDKVLLHILVLLLFETLQMELECFGAVVCSVNLSDSNLMLKIAGSFANRGRGSCFEHFDLHDRGGIAPCVVCFALTERHKDLEFFGFSVWQGQKCKCCYRVVNKHLWQYHFIYWKFRICLLVLFWPSVYPCIYISYVWN